MLTIEQVQQKWGKSQRSIRGAIREKRIRSCSQDGAVLIPDDEIYALPQKAIQAFLWTIIKYRNDMNSAPDFSMIEQINANQISSVFKQLVFRKYLDKIDGRESVDECYRKCRITELGMELIQRKILPGSPIPKRIAELGFQTFAPTVFNWLFQNFIFFNQG